MSKDFTPRPYQTTIIRYILDNKRCAIWSGMGTGKTSATLTALDILQLIESGPVLIIAPKRVALSTWPDEIAKWSHLSHLTVQPVVGALKDRKAALTKRADIYTSNYDNLVWLVDYLGKRWPFKTVIADESTRLKSFRIRQGGRRAQALAKVAFRLVDRFVLLTGTPAPNGLVDLWGQQWFVDKGERLGYSFKAFTDRWFRSVRVGDDAFAVKLEPLAFSRQQIEDQLRDVCLTIDARDYFDVAEPIVNVIQVELPPKARALYRDMERDMFVQLESGQGVEAFNAATKTMKCLQLASGAIYTNDKGDFEEVHDAKLDALDSIIEEAAGMPVLVAYHFKSDLARLQKRFSQGRKLDDNPATIRDWNAGKIPVLFAHPQSAGHGLNLQDGGNIIAIFSHWWNLEYLQQILERIGPIRQLQAGYDRPVFIHYIVGQNTLDEQVMATLDGKRTMQDLLLEAMKQR